MSKAEINIDRIHEAEELLSRAKLIQEQTENLERNIDELQKKQQDTRDIYEQNTQNIHSEFRKVAEEFIASTREESERGSTLLDEEANKEDKDFDKIKAIDTITQGYTAFLESSEVKYVEQGNNEINEETLQVLYIKHNEALTGDKALTAEQHESIASVKSIDHRSLLLSNIDEIQGEMENLHRQKVDCDNEMQNISQNISKIETEQAQELTNTFDKLKSTFVSLTDKVDDNVKTFDKGVRDITKRNNDVLKTLDKQKADKSITNKFQSSSDTHVISKNDTPLSSSKETKLSKEAGQEFHLLLAEQEKKHKEETEELRRLMLVQQKQYEDNLTNLQKENKELSNQLTEKDLLLSDYGNTKSSLSDDSTKSLAEDKDGDESNEALRTAGMQFKELASELIQSQTQRYEKSEKVFGALNQAVNTLSRNESLAEPLEAKNFPEQYYSSIKGINACSKTLKNINDDYISQIRRNVSSLNDETRVLGNSKVNQSITKKILDQSSELSVKECKEYVSTLAEIAKTNDLVENSQEAADTRYSKIREYVTENIENLYHVPKDAYEEYIKHQAFLGASEVKVVENSEDTISELQLKTLYKKYNSLFKKPKHLVSEGLTEKQLKQIGKINTSDNQSIGIEKSISSGKSFSRILNEMSEDLSFKVFTESVSVDSGQKIHRDHFNKSPLSPKRQK